MRKLLIFTRAPESPRELQESPREPRRAPESPREPQRAPGQKASHLKPYSQLFDYRSLQMRKLLIFTRAPESSRRAPESPGELQRAPKSPRPEGFSLETLQSVVLL